MSRHGQRDDHATWDELAVGWALHALEPEDEAGFRLHLAGCARCAGTVADATDVMAAMADDLPDAEPSEALRDRLRAAVAGTDQVHRPAPVNTGRPAVVAFPAPAERAERSAARSRWRRAPQLLVAAGAAAVLGLGAWNVALTQDRDAAQATAASQAALLSAPLAPGQRAGARMESDGHVVATVVAHDGQAQVVTDGMSTNDVAASTYVLWGLTDDGAVPLGTFDVVSDAADLRTVGSRETGLDDYSAYAISLEPGREAPIQPTDVVARGQVTS